jgi:phage FluMu protein Com
VRDDLSEADWNDMTPEQKRATPQGRPCPWCEKIIESSWTKHTFVRFTCPTCKVVQDLRPGPAHDLLIVKGECACGQRFEQWKLHNVSELMGDCPHCGQEYMLKAGP